MNIFTNRERRRCARELLGQRSLASCLFDVLLGSAALFAAFYAFFSEQVGRGAGGVLISLTALGIAACAFALVFSIRLDGYIEKSRAKTCRETLARRALLCPPRTLLCFAAQSIGLSGEYREGVLVSGKTLLALLRLFPGELASPGTLLHFRDAAAEYGCANVILLCTSDFSDETRRFAASLDVEFELLPSEKLLAINGLESILPNVVSSAAAPPKPRTGLSLKKALLQSSFGYVRCALLILAFQLFFAPRSSIMNAYYAAAAALCLALSGFSLIAKVRGKRRFDKAIH